MSTAASGMMLQGSSRRISWRMGMTEANIQPLADSGDGVEVAQTARADDHREHVVAES